MNHFDESYAKGCGLMASVTQRIKQIQQPRGGFIPVKDMQVEEYNDGNVLGEENIHSSLVGMAVDYLTRYIRSNNAEKAFAISLVGASRINKTEYAFSLLKRINGLDEKSIIAACQLSGFDVCARSGISSYKPVENIIPDETTIENIRIMVRRSMTFFEKYGPVIMDGFTFRGGYTEIVDSGDGDYLTADTLWDFKVSKMVPKKEHTLQLLMYYLMGRKSIHTEFNSIKRLGIFNPRLNKVYTIGIDKISKDVISEVSNNVIGYGMPKETIRTDSVSPKKVEQFLTVEQVAKILGISKSKVYSLIRDGELEAEKKGNRYIIYPDVLDLYIEEVKRREQNATIVSIVSAIVILVIFVWAILKLM